MERPPFSHLSTKKENYVETCSAYSSVLLERIHPSTEVGGNENFRIRIFNRKNYFLQRVQNVKNGPLKNDNVDIIAWNDGKNIFPSSRNCSPPPSCTDSPCLFKCLVKGCTYTVMRTENKGEQGMKRRNYERMSRAKSQEKYSLPIGPLRPIPTLLTCISFTVYNVHKRQNNWKLL